MQSPNDGVSKDGNDTSFSPSILRLAKDPRLVHGLLVVLVLDAVGVVDAARLYVGGVC